MLMTKRKPATVGEILTEDPARKMRWTKRPLVNMPDHVKHAVNQTSFGRV
jgi:plasmid maintenance system antidote protein VapI